MQSKPTKSDLALAEICARCPVCRHARKKQKGVAFWLTSKMETRLCPFCRAYERVYGRKSHQPLPSPVSSQVDHGINRPCQ